MSLLAHKAAILRNREIVNNYHYGIECPDFYSDICSLLIEDFTTNVITDCITPACTTQLSLEAHKLVGDITSLPIYVQDTPDSGLTVIDSTTTGQTDSTDLYVLLDADYTVTTPSQSFICNIVLVDVDGNTVNLNVAQNFNFPYHLTQSSLLQIHLNAYLVAVDPNSNAVSSVVNNGSTLTISITSVLDFKTVKTANDCSSTQTTTAFTKTSSLI